MRTQPWYPGVIQTAAIGGGEYEVLTGLTVGWVGEETLLDRGESWWVVPRHSLDPDSELHPAHRVPVARQPHLHRAARICPLVSVSSDQAATLEGVWHGRVVPSERRLVLERDGIEVFSGEIEGDDIHGAQLLDRLLRRLSDGVLWEDAVLLALALAQPLRWPALEKCYADLHGQAGTRVVDARRWAAAVEELPEAGGTHELGAMRRQVLAAVHVGPVALPAFERWVVRAEFEPLEWPEASSERRPPVRSAAQARQLAVGLTLISATLLAGAVWLDLASPNVTRLLVFFVLVGLWMSHRARVPA